MRQAGGKRTLLVLGATGYIGGNVARAAVESGWRVRGLRRRHGALGNAGDLPVEWFEADLDSPASLDEAFSGAEAVLHCAAYYPRRGAPVAEHVRAGVAQTRNVLEACRAAGVRSLVYTSTLTTIARPPAADHRLADERDVYLPGSLPKAAYYECKFAMESEVLRASAQGLPAVILNPTAVIGPGDDPPTLGGVVLAAARGQGWIWLEADVNLVDVRDVAQAHVEALTRGEPGQRHILGGRNLTVREALTLIARLAGVRPPRVRLPLSALDAAAWLSDRLPGLSLLGNHLRAVRHWQGYDCSRAQRVLRFRPRPLEATLEDALQWYAARGWLKPRGIVVA
ncbi:MAG TPA: NAD-dependent epimerase/dehydratase family protein [Anaerolineales bacterium]|nr:NAD-dependent epimerase/dehydratase family protein [Anaerolineales bacterium]